MPALSTCKSPDLVLQKHNILYVEQKFEVNKKKKKKRKINQRLDVFNFRVYTTGYSIKFNICYYRRYAIKHMRTMNWKFRTNS